MERPRLRGSGLIATSPGAEFASGAEGPRKPAAIVYGVSHPPAPSGSPFRIAKTPPFMRDPLDVLRTVFGFETFRGHQAEIVDHVVAGGEALVLMPTGGGKSLCYQRSEEHTSELQPLMRISYPVFCLNTNTLNKSKLVIILLLQATI